MRTLAICGLLLLAVGCHNPCKVCKAPVPCSKETVETCPAPSVPEVTKVEVNPAKDIEVTAPRPKVVVNTPAPRQEPTPPYGAPPPQQPPYGAPPPAYGGVPITAVTALVHSTGGNRIAFGIDWIPIPIPIPRIFSVPAEQTVTLTQPTMPVAPPVFGAAPLPVYQMQPPPCGTPPAYGAPPPCGNQQQQRQAQDDRTKANLDAVEKKLEMVEKLLKERVSADAAAPAK